MITEALLTVVRWVLSALNFLLPDWAPLELTPFVVTIQTAGASVFGLLRWLDWYVPVSESLTLAALGLTLYLGALVYRLAMKLGRTTHLFGGSR